MFQSNNIATHFVRCRRKLGSFLLLAVLCLIMGEVTSRAFWVIRSDVPFMDADLILYEYYPNLRTVDRISPGHDDDKYDILILGGSAMNREYGTVEQELWNQLRGNGYRNIRIFNLAEAAHTSRDSWLKYQALGGCRFDLVIFYHGINEARANNAPPEIFRTDYSHYSWYESVNQLASYHRRSLLALPYTCRFLITSIQQAMNQDRYVPKHFPRQDWVRHGETYRSATSFESNLNGIADLCLTRGDQLLLMTFALYVPEDYSLKAFLEKRLDYSRHNYPIEMWGEPKNVIGAVSAHNEVITRVANRHSSISFIDQAHLMAKTPDGCFDDPCHFTRTGASKFAENMVPAIRFQIKNLLDRAPIQAVQTGRDSA